MITVAVGLIIRTTGEILLCQRRQHLPYPLKWEFPGGKTMVGERTEDCVRRELMEELNIDAEIGALYFRGHYNYPDSGTFDVSYFIVPSFTGAIVNNVFAQIRWVPIADLPRYDILQGNAAVVRKLVNEHAQN